MKFERPSKILATGFMMRRCMNYVTTDMTQRECNAMVCSFEVAYWGVTEWSAASIKSIPVASLTVEPWLRRRVLAASSTLKMCSKNRLLLFAFCNLLHLQLKNSLVRAAKLLNHTHSICCKGIKCWAYFIKQWKWWIQKQPFNQTPTLILKITLTLTNPQCLMPVNVKAARKVWARAQ